MTHQSTPAGGVEGITGRLEEKKAEYVERLDIGAAKIYEGISLGQDTEKWQTYWIGLLREYEAVCDKIRDLKTA